MKVNGTLLDIVFENLYTHLVKKDIGIRSIDIVNPFFGRERVMDESELFVDETHSVGLQIGLTVSIGYDFNDDYISRKYCKNLYESLRIKLESGLNSNGIPKLISNKIHDNRYGLILAEGARFC